MYGGCLLCPFIDLSCYLLMLNLSVETDFWRGKQKRKERLRLNFGAFKNDQNSIDQRHRTRIDLTIYITLRTTRSFFSLFNWQKSSLRVPNITPLAKTISKFLKKALYVSRLNMHVYLQAKSEKKRNNHSPWNRGFFNPYANLAQFSIRGKRLFCRLTEDSRATCWLV